MLGIIGGTSLLFSSLPKLKKETVATPFGSAEILTGEIVMLMRHQFGRPPHRINYRANLAALALAGVDRIVAFGSSGSLKKEIPPGIILIPTDYISVADIPSIHDHKIEHVVPELPRAFAEELSRTVPGSRLGGVYAQSRGPRFETAAEVAALAKVADVVGMTVASEATLACELKMDFAALCTIDNYANGLGKDELSFDFILSTAKENSRRTEEALGAIIEKMG